MTDEDFALFLKEMRTDAALLIGGCLHARGLPLGFSFAVMPAPPPWPPINRIRYWPEGSVGFVSNRQAEIWMMDPEIYRE